MAVELLGGEGAAQQHGLELLELRRDVDDTSADPSELASFRVIGRVAEHLCLEVEPHVYVYWLASYDPDLRTVMTAPGELRN